MEPPLAALVLAILVAPAAGTPGVRTTGGSGQEVSLLSILDRIILKSTRSPTLSLRLLRVRSRLAILEGSDVAGRALLGGFASADVLLAGFASEATHLSVPAGTIPDGALVQWPEPSGEAAWISLLLFPAQLDAGRTYVPGLLSTTLDESPPWMTTVPGTWTPGSARSSISSAAAIHSRRSSPLPFAESVP